MLCDDGAEELELRLYKGEHTGVESRVADDAALDAVHHGDAVALTRGEGGIRRLNCKIRSRRTHLVEYQVELELGGEGGDVDAGRDGGRVLLGEAEEERGAVLVDEGREDAELLVASGGQENGEQRVV